MVSGLLSDYLDVNRTPVLTFEAPMDIKKQFGLQTYVDFKSC